MTNPKPPDAHDIAGTAWIGLEGRHWAIYRLELNGTFDKETALERRHDGTWRQVGDTVLFELRDHSAEYRGKLVGETLEGEAENKKGEKWPFRMVRAPGPARLAELSQWITDVVAAKGR